MLSMDLLFVFPREAWDEAECARRARHAPADAFGNKPPKGLVNSTGSTWPGYGQTVRFNGGTIVGGELYRGVSKPLPEIPDSYEFVKWATWGTRIRLKQKENRHEAV
jgi:hypothetical protein